MSDFGRKDLHKRMEEDATPQSQKSTGEKIKESVTNAADRVASAVTPNSQKSVTQQAADKHRSNLDHAEAHHRNTNY